jgi:hypothetical protein
VGIHKYKLTIQRINSGVTFEGTYREVYEYAIKEARRYNSIVEVVMIDHGFGSAQFWSISPTAMIGEE